MKKSLKNCPEYFLIEGATKGKEMEIQDILKHYDAYISKSCSKRVQDENQISYNIIDTELKGIIISALIKSIYKFDLKVR